MKRLLIIRFSALGDVAMLVPLVKQAACLYPDWDFTMLSRQQSEPLFRDMPANVHFHGVDFKKDPRKWFQVSRLLNEINYHDFDAVADMHDVLRSQYMRTRMFLAGKRVASINKGRIQKWLLVRHSYVYKQPLTPMIERYRAVFTELGFYLPRTVTHTAPDEVIRHNIGVAPFAAHTGKIYPLERMEHVVAALGKVMHAHGEQVFLFGAGHKEKALLDSWATRYEGVVSLVGQLSMDKEIDIMHDLRLMLTMDSSNMHLASLVGTRVLSIWGATHPWTGFLGYGQQESDCIQRPLPCRPCSVYGNRRCQFGDHRCLDIKEDEIIHRVLRVLPWHD